MSKRKWKVYTTDELRDRFQQAAPGGKPSDVQTDDALKQTPPPSALRRRNSAPPGMIHFPPGALKGGDKNNNTNKQDDHYYVPIHNTHNNNNHNTNNMNNNNVNNNSLANLDRTQSMPSYASTPNKHKGRESPGSSHHSFAPTPYSRATHRRSSLPHLPSPGGPLPPIPDMQQYFHHLQYLPPPINFETADNESKENFKEGLKNILCTSEEERVLLPSFQTLLKTINEDEEDKEMSEIEEHARKLQSYKVDAHASYKFPPSPPLGTNKHPHSKDQDETMTPSPTQTTEGAPGSPTRAPAAPRRMSIHDLVS